MDPEVLLARIVVDQADRRVPDGRVLEHFAQDELGRITGADDDDLLAARDDRARGRAFDDRAREQARTGHEREQEQHVNDPDPARDAGRVEVESGEDEVGGDPGGGHAAHRVPHVPRGHVPPPAVVEAEGDEDRQRDPDDENDDVPLEVAVVVHRPRVALEADEPGENPRSRDESGVDHDLPKTVSVHRRAHQAGTPSAARTVCTTRACCSSEMPAQSGTEKFSRAARSVSGRSPSE